MSISMDKFSSAGHFAHYIPQPALMRAVAVFQLQCRSCGFEPESVVTPPLVCPKCHSEAWERFARPRSILENSSTY